MPGALASRADTRSTIDVGKKRNCPEQINILLWRILHVLLCWQKRRGAPFSLFSADVASGSTWCMFNLAHELGHIALHARALRYNAEPDIASQKQANRFAGAFLLPRETFSQEVFGTSISYFRSLKQRSGFLFAAMAYRCKDLKILSPKSVRLFVQANECAAKLGRCKVLYDLFPVEN